MGFFFSENPGPPGMKPLAALSLELCTGWGLLVLPLCSHPPCPSSSVTERGEEQRGWGVPELPPCPAARLKPSQEGPCMKHQRPGGPQRVQTLPHFHPTHTPEPRRQAEQRGRRRRSSNGREKTFSVLLRALPGTRHRWDCGYAAPGEHPSLLHKAFPGDNTPLRDDLAALSLLKGHSGKA